MRLSHKLSLFLAKSDKKSSALEPRGAIFMRKGGLSRCKKGTNWGLRTVI